MNTVEILHIAAPLAAGLLGGIVYFALLARAARLFAEGGSAFSSIGLLVARVGIALALFWFAVQFGMAALLLTLVGFQAGRMLLQRIVLVQS